MEVGGDGSLRGGLRRGGQGWPQRGARRTGLPQGRISPDSGTAASLTAVQPAHRVHCGLARRPESALPLPFPDTPASRGPASLSRHTTFSWSARRVCPLHFPVQQNALESRTLSPSRRCQHIPGVLPTLAKRQTHPSHLGPGPARRPQAGSQRLGPPETAAPRAPARLPISPLCVSPMSTLPAARALGCTHVCSPPLNARSFLVLPSSQSVSVSFLRCSPARSVWLCSPAPSPPLRSQ